MTDFDPNSDDELALDGVDQVAVPKTSTGKRWPMSMKAFNSLDELLATASDYAKGRGFSIQKGPPRNKDSLRVDLVCGDGEKQESQRIRRKNQHSYQWKATTSYSRKDNKWHFRIVSDGHGDHPLGDQSTSHAKKSTTSRNISAAKQLVTRGRQPVIEHGRRTRSATAALEAAVSFTVYEAQTKNQRVTKHMVYVFCKEDAPFNKLQMEPHLAGCEEHQRARRQESLMREEMTVLRKAGSVPSVDETLNELLIRIRSERFQRATRLREQLQADYMHYWKMYREWRWIAQGKISDLRESGFTD